MNCLIFGLYRKKRGELTVRITGGISCSKELKAKPMGYIRGDSKISGFHGPLPGKENVD